MDRINQEYEQERTAIIEKYGSKFGRAKEIRRDKTLSDNQKAQKLEELNKEFEKRDKEMQAADAKRVSAYNKADNECSLVFEPDYEYSKISGSHGIRDDADRKIINPEGLDMNCQRCAVAYEMRRRGYDVRASAGGNSLYDELANTPSVLHCFVGAETKDFSSLNADELTSQVRKQMLDWGDGSRAIICLNRRGEYGHVVNMCNSDGEIFFIDSQLGVSWSDKTSLKAGGRVNLGLDTAINVTVIRTDNATPGIDVDRYVRKVGE